MLLPEPASPCAVSIYVEVTVHRDFHVCSPSPRSPDSADLLGAGQGASRWRLASSTRPAVKSSAAGGGGSEARLGVGAPVGDGSGERGVVAFVLVGVGFGEIGDRGVEFVGLAEVGGEGDAVTGAGVRAGQGPAAQARVDRHALGAISSMGKDSFQSRSCRT